ncbi:MAG: S-adenosylmethionine:tRNA ribosyltransferase-isomerase [Chlorobiota bacterium]
MLPKININDFEYKLPENRIAKYPLENRSDSKLLVANKNATEIHHYNFSDVVDLLDDNVSLYINKTKVISGRFYMKKETGGKAQLLLVEPIAPSSDPQIALQARRTSKWKCIIGGKKIRVGSTLTEINNKLTAKIESKNGNEVVAELNWDDIPFSELLLDSGILPLPPYLNRESEEKDKETYQTVFAKEDGSIAAPTAGLHFTDSIIDKLLEKGVRIRELTLHVGPGTFLPVSDDDVSNHDMHSEMFSVTKELLTNLKEDLEQERKIVCVGTTSVRTLESLFWAGQNSDEFKDSKIVKQWSPYQKEEHINPLESINNLLNITENDKLVGKTKLIIVPGYEFKFVKGMFTNFHVPKSTLLLLVSAVLKGNWEAVYKEALDKDYRFLSYGDSSLLWY